jgi:hypothetical protein
VVVPAGAFPARRAATSSLTAPAEPPARSGATPPRMEVLA